MPSASPRAGRPVRRSPRSRIGGDQPGLLRSHRRPGRAHRGRAPAGSGHPDGRHGGANHPRRHAHLDVSATQIEQTPRRCAGRARETPDERAGRRERARAASRACASWSSPARARPTGSPSPPTATPTPRSIREDALLQGSPWAINPSRRAALRESTRTCDQVEAQICFRGRGRVVVDGREHPLVPGTAVLPRHGRQARASSTRAPTTSS